MSALIPTVQTQVNPNVDLYLRAGQPIPGPVDITGDLNVSGTVSVGVNVSIDGNLVVDGTTNLVKGQNAYIIDQTYTAAQPPAAGYTEVVVGTFTPAKAGLYLMSASFGVDANITDGYTAAPPDNIGWTLRPTAPPPYPVDSIGAVTMFVFTVPAGANNDYGGQSAALCKLAAVQYNIIAVVDNISGTMTGPAPLSTRIKLASLA